VLALQQIVQPVAVPVDRVVVDVDDGSGRLLRQRELVVVVADDRFTIRPLEPDGSSGQLSAVVVPEDGGKDPAAEPPVARRPVDVEGCGEPALGTALQHVPPPRVRPSGDRHVVGHDVRDV
jgi:hypothetical protein